MAQTEDTELRDLVIEALEKNGSLAKIRALLRANIFLAFEDECENMRHNVRLDNVLKAPEGIYALSIVHEFLEFCNLKNTLFVYKSESRQGKDYSCDGKKFLYEKLNVNKLESNKEPVLVTLIRNSLKYSYQKVNSENGFNKLEDCGDNGYKDEQNSSYIVHEDSQTSTTSQSDNSLDEKHKLHLRLQLDNSDTDTSTDSSRDKSASEYIPGDHVLEIENSNKTPRDTVINVNETNITRRLDENLPTYFTKITGNSSSDSTSYIDLKPYSSIDEKMLNTTGLPSTEPRDQPTVLQTSEKQSDLSKTDSAKSATLSSVSSLSLKNNSFTKDIVKKKKSSQESSKSEGEAGDYSYDFTTSQASKDKDCSDEVKTPNTSKRFENNMNKTSPVQSPHQNSQSSISISDVADLISEKSSSFEHHTSKGKSINQKLSSSDNSKMKSASVHHKLNSDDSGDFSESPIPSLSNLSLDIHSD